MLERAKHPHRYQMSKRAAIVSLHFSPAFVSHMIALGRLMRELGYEVTFVLQEEYAQFVEFSRVGDTIFPEGCFSAIFDVAVFCNAAVNNHALCAQLRKQGAIVFYIFHEPDSVLNRLAEGWWDIFKLIVARYSSIAMLKRCSEVIVPSHHAQELYKRYFSRYNRCVHTMSLLFDDEVGADTIILKEKRYFSFIGNAVKGHDFGGFIRLVKHSIRAGSAVPFAIATKSDLSVLLSRDGELSRYVDENRVLIQHGRVLTNNEINRHNLTSFCVWNAYRCSTQSGVLPRAFMAGTPVIARRVGSFDEYVRSGVNGEFIESADDDDAILRTAEKIRQNLPMYVEGSRKTFMEKFFYKAHRDTLCFILNGVREESENRKCESLG